jgi:hypothetical protein
MTQGPGNGVTPAYPGEGDDQFPMVALNRYAGGTWTEVLEAQRRGTVEQIVVSQGLPMGPRGHEGPTGPTGAKGESTKWHVYPTTPTLPTTENEFGEIWLDSTTGIVYVYGPDGWVASGSDMIGPTGPTGPTGPEPDFFIKSVVSVQYPTAGVTVEEGPTGGQWGFGFLVPWGPTGPEGPAPVLETQEVYAVEYGDYEDLDVVLSLAGVAGHYKIDWYLPQGPPGDPGVFIYMKGQLPNPGSPGVGNPPGSPGPAEDPAVNDGWLADDGRTIWVFSELSSWLNIGLISGPAGPTGPQGLQQRSIELPITVPPANSNGGCTIMIDHNFAEGSPYYPFNSNYPSVRFLLETTEGSGIWEDSRSVYVYYPSTLMVGVQLDGSYAGRTCKVILS